MSHSYALHAIIGLQTIKDGFDMGQLPELRTFDSLDYVTEIMDKEINGGFVSTDTVTVGKQPKVRANMDTGKAASLSKSIIAHADFSAINFQSTPDLETDRKCVSSTHYSQDRDTANLDIELSLPRRDLGHGSCSHHPELQCEQEGICAIRDSEGIPNLRISPFKKTVTNSTKLNKEAVLNSERCEDEPHLISILNHQLSEKIDQSYKPYMLPLDIFHESLVKKGRAKGSDKIVKSIKKGQSHGTPSKTKTKKGNSSSSKCGTWRKKNDSERKLYVSERAVLPIVAKYRTLGGRILPMRVEILLRQGMESLYYYLCHAFGMFAWYAVGSRKYQCVIVDDEQIVDVLTRRNLEHELQEHLATEGLLSERGVQLAAKRLVHNRKYEALCPFCECVFKTKSHFESHKLYYDKM